MPQQYPRLFAPGKIGRMTVKNRLVYPPMEILGAGFNGEMSDDMIAYYEERARAGVGLIITAYASVDDEFSQSFAGAQLKLTDPRHTSAMSKLARVMHKYEAKVWVQIYQAGRQAVPTSVTGKRMIAPSPVGYSLHDQIPEEMSREEIRRSVCKFATAALILKNAGMDGVEVLAAGGYLINQFLSPYSNKRIDDYGGSFENRMRFLNEIIAEIRKTCGFDFTLSVRFSADEFTEGGYGLKEGVKIARALEAAGVDCLNVNNANQEHRYYIIEPTTFKTGWKSPIIKAIKDAVSIPVIATNVIKKPEQAEQFLQDGIMDFAAVGRGMYADPEWARKAREGRSEDIKPCIGCLYCLEQTAKFRRSSCAVNCRTGRELEFPPLKQDLAGKTIVVVGAGPAGMEAAIVLQQRGAQVTVFEKNAYTGGAAELGARTPDKEPLKALVTYYAAQAKKMGIELRLNTEATVDSVIACQPYAIFVGTGATPLVPPFKGLDKARYLTIPEALADGVRFTGQKIAVIGGGMTGCETAEHFALMGNAVTLVEMQEKLAPEVDPDNLVTVLRNLKANKARILLSRKLMELTEHTVIVEHTTTGEQLEVQVDTIILSLGNRPDTHLYQELTELHDKVYLLGDARQVGRVANAVHTAYQAAFILE